MKKDVDNNGYIEVKVQVQRQFTWIRILDWLFSSSVALDK